jgi:poly(A) polymerase
MGTIQRLTGCFLSILLAACASHPQVPNCSVAGHIGDGWSSSFTAGCFDRNGVFAGGSQVMHLLAHKGRLYAANGYWEDAHNIWYGGSDPTGWGQVLSLSGPGQPWVVDFNLGPQHLRTELLKSVVFTQDAKGRPLPEPESVLLAATFDGSGRNGVDVFVRNDDTGTWTKSPLIRGNTGKSGGDDISVRAATVYRDRLTGREKLFISVGVLGLYTGSFDPSVPGRIAWDPKPESPAVSGAGTRILAIVEGNDNLFYSEGTKIFRRIDGEQPRYELVLDMSGQVDSRTSRARFQSIGGIRGLSAIEGSVPGRKSLIFVWHNGSQSQACIHRLDPKPDGSWSDRQEVCLAQLASRHIGAPVSFVLGAYSNFLPLSDPSTGELLHVVGIEAFIPGRGFDPLTAHNQRYSTGGHYAGALYALRDSKGGWRIGEVGGKFRPGKRELVSVYTYAMSPFGGTDEGRIYLGGYDPNHFASTNTAWVANAPLAELLKTH